MTTVEPEGRSEHHWSDAVTDVVAPTPETEEAIDSQQERADSHRKSGEDLQSAITAVADTHLGAQREVVNDALRRELEARGLWPQPQPWLNAVAADLEAGQHYRVGTD